MEFNNYIQNAIAPEIIHAELDNFFPYFKTLSPELKKRFVNRTYHFIKEKKFVPRQNLFLSQHIVIIISACAIQITFGLDEYLIEHFEYVLIYPDIYDSPVTGKRHRGETNLGGFICLSWNHVQTGVDNTNDNYNLGLHEWMHALRFNSFKGARSDYFFEAYINKWIATSMHEYRKLRRGEPSIFRKYGAENINEFLSVCTEHFFESPDEFEKESSELFKQTCILLNQKPSKTQTLLSTRDKFLLITPPSTYNEAPKLEIEASLRNTLFNFGIRFIAYIFFMFILIPQNTTFSNFTALLLTIGAIVFMNNRYFTIQFYDKTIFFQKGFFDLYAQKATLSYAQIIKVEKEDSQFDSNANHILNFTFYDGYEFKTKRVILNSFNIPTWKITEILKEKNILNNI